MPIDRIRLPRLRDRIMSPEAAAALFAVTRSLMAAVLLDNILATVGFATRGLALPLSPETSVLLAAVAVAAFAAVFAWASQGNDARRDGTAMPPPTLPAAIARRAADE